MTTASNKSVFAWAAACAAAVALIPGWMSQGPDAGLDASAWLSSGRFFTGAGVVFLGGLLTALTPCVYPLIPITVSIFGARRADSRARSVLFTAAFVVGMGAVFSLLGVAAAKTGQAFGSALGSPWVAAGLAVFLLSLAASMFGAFELSLPSSWLQRLSGVGGHGLAGAFLMGSVSGFLAAPCTGPVLSGLLAFVAKSQNTALGAGLLFIYALGVGAPFFAIGAFTLRLPKGGAWMEWVKSALGVMLVALAASYLKDAWPALRERIADLAGSLGPRRGVGLAALLAGLGVWLGALHLSFKSGARASLLKSAGISLVVAGLLLRVGALDAGRAGSELAWHLKLPEQAAAVGPFEQALARAKESGRPVMIDFSAEWCAACKELDRMVYVAPAVVREAGRFVTIKIDSTRDEDEVAALQQRLGVQGLPTVAFFSSQGELLRSPRVTGFLPPDRFLAELKKVR